MDIKQLITIIRKWMWLLLIGMLLAGAGSYYVSSLQTPIYQSSTRFVVMRAAQTTYDVYSYLDSQQLISTYTELLTTERLIQKASVELGFEVSVGQASAVQVGETQFVRLTVRDEIPQEASAIANALVSLLIDENEELQAVRYIAAEENLQNRIDESQRQIEILQKEINDLSTSTVEDQLAQVGIQIDDLQAQILDLERKLADYDELSATQEEKAQYAADELTLAQIEPVLSLYQEIYTNLVVLGEPVQSGNQTSNRLEQLQTTLNLYQQIYISSISSLESVRLMRAQNMPNVVQVESASVPSKPISPKPFQTGFIGALVGLVFTARVVFLIEYLDDTIKTPDDVKNAIGLPVIGLIAELRHKGSSDSKEKIGQYVAMNPRSPVSEAFRSLRANLEFSSLDEPIKMIVVTSAGESEGKTTVASNLALIQAQGKKRTLLIDCDLRRPNIHKQFSLLNRIGLSDLIRGQIDPNEIIQSIPDNSFLNIVPSGSLPPNPAEYLGSARFSSLLDKLRKMYDVIILDTPPMVVADVLIISPKVDGVLFVVKPGDKRIDSIKASIEDLQRIGVKLLGIVLNQIPRNRDYYYGAYKYYSPYSMTNKYNQKGLEFRATQQTNLDLDDNLDSIKIETNV